MTNQSIRDEMSETLFHFYDHGTQPNAFREADALLASPVIRRIQAKAWDEAVVSASLEETGHRYYVHHPENPYRDEDPNV